MGLGVISSGLVIIERKRKKGESNMDKGIKNGFVEMEKRQER